MYQRHVQQGFRDSNRATQLEVQDTVTIEYNTLLHTASNRYHGNRRTGLSCHCPWPSSERSIQCPVKSFLYDSSKDIPSALLISTRTLFSPIPRRQRLESVLHYLSVMARRRVRCRQIEYVRREPNEPIQHRSFTRRCGRRRWPMVRYMQSEDVELICESVQ